MDEYIYELVEAKIDLAILKYELVKMGYRIPKREEIDDYLDN